MSRIYLDHAATTPMDPDVLNAMLPYMGARFGNASSIHAEGRNAQRAVDTARKQLAAAIGADAGEVYFTSGGTESDNWALKGAAFANRAKGTHIISTPIEHHAVLHTLDWLQKQGFTVTLLPVDSDGLVKASDLERAITPETILVSVMAANNEIGTLEPIQELGALVRERGVLFHTDAVQAIGAIPVDVREWQVDMLSLSAHKFHGPMGMGALYIRKGVSVERLVHGGAQERGRRASTENLPGIVGLGSAIEKACGGVCENAARLTALRDKLIQEILSAIPETRLNGHPTLRLPGNVNISIRYIEGEALLLRLDMADISASSGSACTSGSLDPSHVLLAIGLDHATAHGSLRLSLGTGNQLQDVEQTLAVLPGIVESLRAMSPLYTRG